MADIFDEVSEELKQDQLKKKFGMIILNILSLL